MNYPFILKYDFIVLYFICPVSLSVAGHTSFSITRVPTRLVGQTPTHPLPVQPPSSYQMLPIFHNGQPILDIHHGPPQRLAIQLLIYILTRSEIGFLFVLPLKNSQQDSPNQVPDQDLLDSRSLIQGSNLLLPPSPHRRRPPSK